jgi:hypothetical protein
VSCGETSLQAQQASGLVEVSLDLSLLATPGDIRRTRKELGEPDPWTLSCHKIFVQKPKNRHFEGGIFGVLGPSGQPKLPLTLLLMSGYPSKGAH